MPRSEAGQCKDVPGNLIPTGRRDFLHPVLENHDSRDRPTTCNVIGTADIAFCLETKFDTKSQELIEHQRRLWLLGLRSGQAKGQEAVSDVRFVERFADHGARPALVFPDGRTISYAELERRVAQGAAGLGAQKRLVAIEAERTEQAIVGYLSALRGCHTVALLPPGAPDQREQFEAQFVPDVVLRRVDDRWRQTEAAKPSGAAPHPDLALMLGTSGSTGKSRFVRLSTRAVEADAAAIGDYLGLGPQERAALLLPIHYSYGLSVLNSHLAVGASVYIAGKSAADAGFAEEMRQAGCTNIAGVPYTYELLEKTGFLTERLPELRFMTAAGGRMPPALVDTFRQKLAGEGKRFFVMYGQTEATARIAYVPPESLADNADCIGLAIPGGTLELVDEAGKPVLKPDQPGELVYRGPNVMMGYAESRADLARCDEVEALHTGDIATCDANGFYRIVGRTKRMSKIAGLRINHEAIEVALLQQGISATVVGDDQMLRVAVTSAVADERVVRAAMSASGLSALQVEVRRIGVVPRLASGKVDLARSAPAFRSASATKDGDAAIRPCRRVSPGVLSASGAVC